MYFLELWKPAKSSPNTTCTPSKLQVLAFNTQLILLLMELLTYIWASQKSVSSGNPSPTIDVKHTQTLSNTRTTHTFRACRACNLNFVLTRGPHPSRAQLVSVVSRRIRLVVRVGSGWASRRVHWAVQFLLLCLQPSIASWYIYIYLI